MAVPHAQAHGDQQPQPVQFDVQRGPCVGDVVGYAGDVTVEQVHDTRCQIESRRQPRHPLGGPGTEQEAGKVGEKESAQEREPGSGAQASKEPLVAQAMVAGKDMPDEAENDRGDKTGEKQPAFDVRFEGRLRQQNIAGPKRRDRQCRGEKPLAPQTTQGKAIGCY